MDLKQLSLREKAAQTVIWKANPEVEADHAGDSETFFRRYPVGGIFIGGEVIKKSEDTLQDVSDKIERYRNYLKIPPIFCADFECGCGAAVRGLSEFPEHMALGAIGSGSTAYEWGRITATEAASVGIQWSFSPVADINMNRYNPITSYRALSDRSARVARLLPREIKGMQENGLAATVKHFPGDGVDYRDQHFVTTCNSLPLDRWKNTYGKVFRNAIDAGVMAVMPGHITLPVCQGAERVNGRFLPATRSHSLITDLLKGEMGFRGVVVSDALVMGGFQSGYKTRVEAELEAFRAGVDMMLWPSLEYIDCLCAAIESGEIEESRLDDALKRISELKEKTGVFRDKTHVALSEKLKEKHYRFTQAVADRSLTLLRNDGDFLPLKNPRKITIIAIIYRDYDFERLSLLVDELESRGIGVFLKRNEVLQKDFDESDAVIVLLQNRPHSPVMHLGFDRPENQAIWDLNRVDQKNMIAVSLGSPYLLPEMTEFAGCAINGYGLTDCNMRALAKAILGEIKLTAKSPVKLQEHFIRK